MARMVLTQLDIVSDIILFFPLSASAQWPLTVLDDRRCSVKWGKAYCDNPPQCAAGSAKNAGL